MLMQSGCSREQSVGIEVADSTNTKFVNCSTIGQSAENSQILPLVFTVKMDKTQLHSTEIANFPYALILPSVGTMILCKLFT